MPTISAGLYRVRLFSIADSQEMLNVFYYRENTGSTGYDVQLWSAFDASVLPAIANIQHTAITYTNLVVDEPTTISTEYSATPTTTVGTVAGSRMNNAYAASIRLFRQTKELRSGWKRFSGLVEENVNTNSLVGAYVTLLNTAATAIAGNIAFGGRTYIPILARPPGVAGNPGPTYIYTDIVSASAVDRPTTQNSRKSF